MTIAASPGPYGSLSHTSWLQEDRSFVALVPTMALIVSPTQHRRSFLLSIKQDPIILRDRKLLKTTARSA